ncbi:MAG: hypothetical protein GAK32_01005 [Pseudomonas fluorescens]|nr:MAG: hypothetical protein GAK32_01005 [Pseudomonas fluorescens]
MKPRHSAGLALLLMSLNAAAIEPGPSSPQQKETENWMTLQLSGKVASPTPQKTSAAERELTLQRWLDSHRHPIPEYFEQKQGGTTTGSSN